MLTLAECLDFWPRKLLTAKFAEKSAKAAEKTRIAFSAFSANPLRSLRLNAFDLSEEYQGFMPKNF